MNRAWVLFIILILSVNSLFGPAIFVGAAASYEPDGHLDAHGSRSRDDSNRTDTFFFDFGARDSPVMEGYSMVTSNDRYSNGTGWGLLSDTEASATDRVAFVGVANPFLIYTGGSMGGALLAPQYTYTGLGRDFAAMVHQWNMSGGTILLYGFYEGTRDAGITAWALEPGATYRMKGSPDEDGDMGMDSVDQIDTFVYTSTGTFVPVEIPGGVEYLITFERIEEGSGLSLLPDLAWGEGEIMVNKENGIITTDIINIGSRAVENIPALVVYEDNEGVRSIIAKGRINIDAPSGFNPAMIMVNLSIIAEPPANGTYILIIDPDGEIDQITRRNDERAVVLHLVGSTVNPDTEREDDEEDEEDSKADPILLLFMVIIFFVLTALIFTMDIWYPQPEKETGPQNGARVERKEPPVKTPPEPAFHDLADEEDGKDPLSRADE